MDEKLLVSVGEEVRRSQRAFLLSNDYSGTSLHLHQDVEGFAERLESFKNWDVVKKKNLSYEQTLEEFDAFYRILQPYDTVLILFCGREKVQWYLEPQDMKKERIISVNEDIILPLKRKDNLHVILILNCYGSNPNPNFDHLTSLEELASPENVNIAEDLINAYPVDYVVPIKNTTIFDVIYASDPLASTDSPRTYSMFALLHYIQDGWTLAEVFHHAVVMSTELHKGKQCMWLKIGNAYCFYFQGSSQLKRIMFAGETGGGKSHAIEQLSNGKIKGISSAKLQSFTQDSIPYSIPSLGAIVNDTPGFGDSEGREMVFYTKILETLFREKGGLHRLYLFINGSRSRVDTTVKQSIFVTLALFGNPSLELVKFVITNMDRQLDESELAEKQAEWKQQIHNMFTTQKLSTPEILFIGKESVRYPQGISELSTDIKSCSMDQIIQTELMKKLQQMEEDKKKAQMNRKILEVKAAKDKEYFNNRLAQYNHQGGNIELAMAELTMWKSHFRAAQQAVEDAKRELEERVTRENAAKDLMALIHRGTNAVKEALESEEKSQAVWKTLKDIIKPPTLSMSTPLKSAKLEDAEPIPHSRGWILGMEEKWIEHFEFSPNLFDYDSHRDGVGLGAFGTVFKSTYLEKLPVAVKVQRDPKMWENEARFLNSLCHPNVVEFFGYGMNDRNIYYLLLELGQSDLSKFLDSKVELSFGTRISIALGIAEGVQYLHSRNPPIFHRDLKAGNISLRSDGTPFLIDFGLSKLFPSGESRTEGGGGENNVENPFPDSHVPEHSREKGTRGYMAPEMLSRRRGPTSLASDVYSLGRSYYEILTRTRPPSSIHLEIPTPEDCPRKYVQLIRACLRENPDNRPKLWEIIETLKEIGEDLRLTTHITDALGSLSETARKLIVEYVQNMFQPSKPILLEKRPRFALVDGKHLYTQSHNMFFGSLDCLSMEGEKLTTYEGFPERFYTDRRLNFVYLLRKISKEKSVLIRLQKGNLTVDHKWDLPPFEGSFLTFLCINNYEDQLYLTIDPRNRIFSCHLDGARSQISRFLGWGRWGRAAREFNAPTGLCCDDFYLYVCDSLNHRIQVLNRKQKGKFVRQFGKQGRKPGTFEAPQYIVKENDHLYISDKFRIQIFTLDGAFVQYVSFRAISLSVVGEKVYALAEGDDRITVWHA